MGDESESIATEYAVVASIFSTNGTALVVTMVLTWLVFWGAFSAVVFGSWQRPAYWWLIVGVLGPLGPIVALIVGSIISRRSWSGDVQA